MDTIKTITGYHQGHFYTLFEPIDTEIKGTVLVLHGMQEHSGRYHELAKILAQNKYCVLTYDHLGHGKTAKNEADFGFFAKENPADKLVNNADTMGDFLHQKYPHLSHFVIGHSMGSFVTRCLLQKSFSKYKGAVLIGTGDAVIGSKLLMTYLSLLNNYAPKKRSSFVNNLFSKMNNVKFKNENNASSTNWLSVNEENRKAFDNDPLCGIPFTNNGFYTLLKVQMKATHSKWASRISKDFPMLFLSGEDDPIGDFNKGITNIINTLKKNNHKNISVKTYPKMRHEIMHEDIKGEVFQTIVSWLNELSK